MSTPAQSLVSSAVGLGYDALSDRMLKECLLVAAQLGGGGGGTAQFVTYTSGQPANPTNMSLPALAYDPTGNLPTLGWNVNTLAWT